MYTEEQAKIIDALNERLEENDDGRRLAQERFKSICDKLRRQLDELEDSVNNMIEKSFTAEDARFQAMLNEIRAHNPGEAGANDAELSDLIKKAKAELFVKQTYDFVQPEKDINLKDLYTLTTKRAFVHQWFDPSKPTELKVVKVSEGKVYLKFSRNPYVDDILAKSGLGTPKAFICGKNGEAKKEYSLRREDGSTFSFLPDGLVAETAYSVSVKVVCDDRESEMSDTIEFTMPTFDKCCVWKRCPDYVDDEKKYTVDSSNPRIAVMTSCDGATCTIISNTSLPLGKVTSWNIKIKKSEEEGNGINIGVAPSDIDQNADTWDRDAIRGWFFNCYESVISSGPPHNYRSKEYGPRKWTGEYVHTGSSVGIIMDTGKGELSYVLNGVNCGVAYEGIPLDKPLVPCVFLYCYGDSIEFVPVKEFETAFDKAIAVPENVEVSSSSWDSIKLTWNAVDDESFYQIEVNGSRAWSSSSRNSFTFRELRPNTEYNFRVRTIKERKVGEWSSVVKAMTQEAPDFSVCAWKECPDYVEWENKYTVDKKNPRIASMCDSEDTIYSVVVGNTQIPLNSTTIWYIKILKSWNGDGYFVHVGVAPDNINQNMDNSCNVCGWYLHCFDMTLHSGPPHCYNEKKYGPDDMEEGQYVKTGDVIGIVMDTERRELSFIVDGVNLGVAYEGIPLDRPLLPCVHLASPGDSIELLIK